METQITLSSLNSTQKEELLWKLAKKRSSFKWNFISFLAVNGMLVTIWYMTTGGSSPFWPIYPIMGWGISILIQYLQAYKRNNIFSVTNEFEKLKQQYSNQ